MVDDLLDREGYRIPMISWGRRDRGGFVVYCWRQRDPALDESQGCGVWGHWGDRGSPLLGS